MSTISIESLNNKLSELYEEYKNDEYILNKLTHHINHDLSAMLISAKKQQKNRVDRRSLLIEGHDKFVKEFINKNSYFHCSTTEIFFKYDNHHYNIIKEDDVIHSILASLSHRYNEHQLEYYEQQLLPWKFKIKTSIIKQLRELSVFTSLPESSTIQYVINLFLETFFNTRNEVKYFLTILGDTILKKQNNNIYFISSTAKTLIRLLENQGGKYFGHIPLQNLFRYKYHDHDYNICRLLTTTNIKSNTEVSDKIYESLQKNIIDIFVVCCYYSNRYENADEYLNSIQDNDLCNHVLYLKNNDQSEIINTFIDSKIQKSTGSIISMKNMLYLWKCYLDEINIPYIMFFSNLKTLLKDKLEFNVNDESFYGYTSLGLPLVSTFIKFWDTSMKEDFDEYFLEIDEICVLFKQSLGGKTSLEIKEYNILNLIKHFYPDIVIENNKYIYGVGCNSWCKKDEIKDFLEYSQHNNLSDLTLYELYCEYTKKISKKKNLTINKSYFDLFITEHVKENTMI